MTQDIWKECKSMLEKRKKELLENKDDRLEQSLEDTVGELSTFDNHPADMGTELFEREKEITLNERKKQELEEIDQALQAMKDGTYDLCQECGRKIKEERLLAAPTTRYCFEHGK